ncbi:MAG: hypothetical protein NUK54_09255, partial [Methanothrix sp.]|nr:hypothetical protein [Methanothrix sp.]
KNEALRLRMGYVGREIAERYYSWNRVALMTEALYEGLIKGV